LATIFLVFAFTVPQGRFVQRNNLENILVQSTVVAACAVGASLVIISGGIDLSAGSLIALSVVTIAAVLDWQWNEVGRTVTIAERLPRLAPWLAVAAGLAVATLAGGINGLLVTRLRIVPFIVTLGGLQLYRGIAKGVCGEQNIYPPESWINSLMDPVQGDRSREWMVLPPGVWITLAAALVAGLLLSYMRLGRHVFAVGSNEQTARLCGVQVERTKTTVYLLAGFFAGLAGVLQYAYLGIGEPTTAIGYELLVIASVVIGGGSLLGGEGSITGTVIGALTISVLAAGCIQMGWPKWVQEIVTGGIIIAAVAIDQIRHRRLSD
jgi:ribose transport system permease protein/erythritol transport system permease protein